MTSKRKLLRNWKLYPIVDDGMFGDSYEFREKFIKLIHCPVQVIQLRIKKRNKNFYFAPLRKIIKKSLEKNIPVIINDRPEMAIELGASGVHLGKSDMPVPSARKLLGAKSIIGKTVRTESEAVKAEKDGADYVSIGPVFYTPLKSDLKNIPFSVINKVCSAPERSVVAIGGITDKNIGEIMPLGVKTVSFMRYALSANGTEKAIKVLASLVDESK